MTEHLQRLEPRLLLAAVFPTAVEQYEVELINAARTNPSAEAARHGIALNEGLPPGTISTAPKQPLAINPNITDAARRHSQWMIDNDLFQHTGSGGSSAHQRMSSAGYVFTVPFSSGENLAYRGTSPSVPDPYVMAGQLHADLFIDAGIAGRGHRTNMLDPTFREIGAGIVSGQFNTFNAVMLTTDFAASGTGSFLTGAAYNDTSIVNNFYSPGEGLGGATVSAKRIGDGAVISTTTFGSGGYGVKLPTGTWIVTASGTGFTAELRYPGVYVGSVNVKRDFRPADAGIIRGNVFDDLNRNGRQDVGESGIPNILVHIDAHRDGRRNNAELYSRTNADGAFRFLNLAPGTYRVRPTLPAGMTPIAPASGYQDVVLGAGRIAGGRNFAAAATASAMALTPIVFSSGPSDEDRILAGLL
jgi:hypothetical protein